MIDIKDRTQAHSLRVIRLYDALPKRGAGRVIGEQLLRSATSVGAHDPEAIRSRSAAEYAAKLNAGLMELEESLTLRRLAALENGTSELSATRDLDQERKGEAMTPRTPHSQPSISRVPLLVSGFWFLVLQATR